MTHDDLVHASLGWLRHIQGCACVFSEKRGNGAERPDAIGFGFTGAVLVVEAKVSLRDAQMNRKKPHHFHGGLGHMRYLAIPRSLAPAIMGDPVCAHIYEEWGVITFADRGYRSFDYVPRFHDGGAPHLAGNQHPKRIPNSSDLNVAYLARRYTDLEKEFRRKSAEERRVIEAAKALNALRHGPDDEARRDAVHELKYAIRALEHHGARKTDAQR